MAPCPSEAPRPEGCVKARNRRERQRAEPGHAIVRPAVNHDERKNQGDEKAGVDRQKNRINREVAEAGTTYEGPLASRSLEQPAAFLSKALSSSARIEKTSFEDNAVALPRCDRPAEDLPGPSGWA